jgi:hypothetical protein
MCVHFQVLNYNVQQIPKVFKSFILLRVQIMVFCVVTLAWRDLGKPVQQHILVKTGARQFPVTILWALLLHRYAHWDSSEICLVTFGDKMCERANTTSLPMFMLRFLCEWQKKCEFHNAFPSDDTVLYSCEFGQPSLLLRNFIWPRN